MKRRKILQYNTPERNILQNMPAWKTLKHDRPGRKFYSMANIDEQILHQDNLKEVSAT
jgi:hypothetical protein